MTITFFQILNRRILNFKFCVHNCSLLISALMAKILLAIVENSIPTQLTSFLEIVNLELITVLFPIPNQHFFFFKFWINDYSFPISESTTILFQILMAKFNYYHTPVYKLLYKLTYDLFHIFEVSEGQYSVMLLHCIIYKVLLNNFSC